jgi:hypothetical protein
MTMIEETVADYPMMAPCVKVSRSDLCSLSTCDWDWNKIRAEGQRKYALIFWKDNYLYEATE